GSPGARVPGSDEGPGRLRAEDAALRQGGLRRRHRRQRRGGPEARPREQAQPDHARRDDAGNGRLGGVEEPEGRSAAFRNSRRHDHDRRRAPARPGPRSRGLPRQARGPQPPGGRAGGPPRRAGGLGAESAVPKILLVEANEMNRDMLSRRLTKRGYEVVMAVDGEEGVSRARSDAPDLILMDMSLPVLDGWQATRKIKSDPATREIPIVALTAHAMAGDEEKA